MDMFTTRKTILIAEDDDLSYMYFETYFSRANINVLRANDGWTAVEICRKYKINLVIMDISLPQMDGLEATKEIREFNSSIPIIISTGWLSEESETLSQQAGCNRLIIKPVVIKTLKDIIDEYLICN